MFSLCINGLYTPFGSIYEVGYFANIKSISFVTS